MKPLTAHLMLSLPSLPLPVASKAAIMPISLPSRFSSPCETMAYLPFDDEAGVEAALGDHQVPHRLAGLRLHGQRRAVGPAGDQQARAVDGDDVHRRVAGVVRTAAGRADPDDVAGALVEGDEALRRGWPACPRWKSGVLTMTRLPSMMGETVRPPCVVNGENSSVMERSHIFLPSLVSAVSRLLTPNDVDVAGFGIGGGRRPGHAVRRHVALIDVELVLPEQLAGVGVEAHERVPARSRPCRRCSAGRGDRRG